MSERLAGVYAVLEELGSGGMGTVYRGVDTRSQQTVAVKQLKSELARPEIIERFRREGEALRELNHPNIVKLLDTLEQDGKHYLVMEYVSGGDLTNLLRQGQMPIEQVLRLAIDLADALTRAHKLNIIHRDLKPANVLIGDDGTLRLTDFGIAHVGSKARVTDTDAIVGTVDYLPPEAFGENTFDAKGDIWAFGVMLFEMLAGERPFKGSTLVQVIHAVATESLPNLETLRPDTPVALVDLVYRMLERDKNARIASVRHVGAALEDLLYRRDTTPQPTRFSVPTPDWIHRPKHNLPAQTTPFVGREHELAELAKLLNDSGVRLITMVAPGGMGKTRLALEVGQQALNQFEDGVYFVELAPVSEVKNIPNALAQAVSYPFAGDGREPKRQILDFLQNKRMLLIMDNYEHLLDGADLVGDILKTAPDVRILATSRQRLSQTGETLFHLSGMEFPGWETPEDALQYAAVKLFMNSARRAHPDFELTADNLDYVARICKLVQGMPLAIVLAASWLGLLSVDEVADEIQQGLDFLETDETELPERQRSMRAVLDYSWVMMTDAEQQTFMKLSVIRGGFTREAAQNIAGANLRLLINLLNKSLIQRDADSGRYTIHELLRQYAHEQLKRSGQEEETLTAHRRYFAHYAHQLCRDLYSSQLTALHLLNTDYDNIVDAWRDAIRRHDEAALDKFALMIVYFQFRTLLHLGFALYIDTWATVSEQNRPLRAKLASALAACAGQMGRYLEAKRFLEESLALVDAITDPLFLAIHKLSLSFVSQFAQNPDAWATSLAEILKLADENGLDYIGANARSMIAYQASLHLRVDESEQIVASMLDKARHSQYTLGVVYGLSHLGEIAIWRGEFEKARQFLDESLRINRQIQVGQKFIDVHVLLGLIALLERDYASVEAHAHEALDFGKSLGFPLPTMRDVHALLARLYIAQGKIDSAREQFPLLLRAMPPDLHLIHGLDLVTIADWFVCQEDFEQAAHLLQIIVQGPMSLAIRKCAVELFGQLPEEVRSKYADTPYDPARIADFIQSLRVEFGEIGAEHNG